MHNEQQEVVDLLRDILDENIAVVPNGHQNQEPMHAGQLSTVQVYMMTFRDMLDYSVTQVNGVNTTRRRHKAILGALPIVCRIYEQGLINLDDTVSLESYYHEGVDIEAGGDGPNNNIDYVFQVLVPHGLPLQGIENLEEQQ